MDTSDLLLWGGLGAVAYYFLFGNSSSAAAPAASAPPAPAPATTKPTHADIVLAALKATGSGPVLVAAQQSGQLPASGMLTASQWNWFLAQVSGIPGMDLSTYLATTAPVSISTWWQAVLLAAKQQSIKAQADAVNTGTTPAGSVSGLGSARQPGRGAVNKFPPPGDNVNGRFDFDSLGWE